MVEVGLNATRTTIVSPFEMPPWIWICNRPCDSDSRDSSCFSLEGGNQYPPEEDAWPPSPPRTQSTIITNGRRA